MRKLMALFLTLTMSLVLLTGCGGTAEKEGGTVPTTAQVQKQKVTDLLGREVELAVPVQRVVAIGPGALRLVTYAEGTSMVVGIEETEKKASPGRSYMMANPDLKKLPGIGQGGPDTAPNEESLVSVQPDVIFVCTLVDKEKADQLQAKTGIPVVALSYGDLATFGEDLYRSINIIGTIIGKEKRAQEVVAYLKQNEKDLGERTKDLADGDKAKVYVGAVSMKGARGIESTQAQYPPFKYIGAKNVVDETGKNGTVMIDKEKLISWNPVFLFLDAGGYALVTEDYKRNPAFYQSLQALKNDRVYNLIPFNNYNPNIDTAFADAYYAGKIIFPEQFKDIDPLKKSDEIYQFLLGKPLYAEMERDLGGFKKLELGK
ncbi:iron ABC transporter substrate-binding protein [Desulfosporosinus youngiae]|uniref:ABC-type Fe3+-hydroxamate transport system, periplasmic component n=1 Tax=Desulfosporosinus youngiae DSM 17734 TaxID=768710 RepID=H5Y680_9FIRM|nr:iron ABC transporter substrate-binding protein [Desulfosporosinus youngiae]EHQ91090.1 ABC-type Fe3+-hydroxamate transport system, periplasmic component [Desulfosporosinus youngiae DSM 17734]